MKNILTDVEKIFEQVYKISTDVIWTIDLEQYNFSYISEGIEKLGGILPADAKKVKLKDALTTSSYDLVIRTLNKELEKDLSQQREKLRGLELELIKKDKSKVWISVNMGPERMEF